MTHLSDGSPLCGRAIIILTYLIVLSSAYEIKGYINLGDHKNRQTKNSSGAAEIGFLTPRNTVVAAIKNSGTSNQYPPCIVQINKLVTSEAKTTTLLLNILVESTSAP